MDVNVKPIELIQEYMCIVWTQERLGSGNVTLEARSSIEYRIASLISALEYNYTQGSFYRKAAAQLVVLVSHLRDPGFDMTGR